MSFSRRGQTKMFIQVSLDLAPSITKLCPLHSHHGDGKHRSTRFFVFQSRIPMDSAHNFVWNSKLLACKTKQASKLASWTYGRVLLDFRGLWNIGNPWPSSLGFNTQTRLETHLGTKQTKQTATCWCVLEPVHGFN